MLKPKQGQNFEQDLQLARALFSLERRIEAIRVLNDYADPKASQMLNLVSTQFFNQETATIYYEALQLITQQKWAEARDKLELALNKEPGHALLLLRLIQCELILDLKDAVAQHLKIALDLNPDGKELKLYSARSSLSYPTLTLDEKESYRIFTSLKSTVQSNQTLTVWYLESLLKLKKTAELAPLQTRFLKEHPKWSYGLKWFLDNHLLGPKEQKAFRTQLDKNLKDARSVSRRIRKRGQTNSILLVRVLHRREYQKAGGPHSCPSLSAINVKERHSGAPHGSGLILSPSTLDSSKHRVASGRTRQTF